MKISVVVPILNPGKRGITRMIKSFIEQDYPDKELIVIDGGSTDGTLEIIKDFDEYISYWISEPDGSVYEAFNKGIRKATGDFISFCGGTDFYQFDAFQAAADAYAKNGGDVLYGDFLMEQKDNSYYYMDCKSEKLEKLMYSAPFGYMGTFMRPNDLIEVWKDFDGTLGDDTFFFSKQYQRGKKFTYIENGSWLQALSYGGIEYSKRYEWAAADRQASYKALCGSKELIEKYGEEIEKTFSRRVYNLWKKILPESRYVEVMSELFPKDKKYIVFGTGDFGKRATSELLEFNCHIKYYVDSNIEKQQESFFMKNVYSPDNLLSEKDCTVVIASYKYNDEMRKQLVEMKLPETVKIISFIDIPYLLYKYMGGDVLEEAYRDGRIK